MCFTDPVSVCCPDSLSVWFTVTVSVVAHRLYASLHPVRGGRVAISPRAMAQGVSRSMAKSSQMKTSSLSIPEQARCRWQTRGQTPTALSECSSVFSVIVHTHCSVPHTIRANTLRKPQILSLGRSQSTDSLFVLTGWAGSSFAPPRLHGWMTSMWCSAK